MKKNEIYGLLLNPFTRIAGWQALLLGAAFTLLIALTGTYANVYFDGAIDVHFTEAANFKSSINYLIIDLLCLVLTLSIAGAYVARNFRLLDILGTVSLAKAPFLILALVALAAEAPNAVQLLQNPSSVFNSIPFVLVMVLSIPILVWYFILLYNAFKTSTGARGVKVVPSFIAAVLMGEIISKVLIYYLL